MFGVSSIDRVLFERVGWFGDDSTNSSPYDPSATKNMPKSIGEGGNDALFLPLLGYVMTGNAHDMLTMFLKLNLGSETEDAYEFILCL